MPIRNIVKTGVAAWWSAFGKTQPGAWILLYHVFDRESLSHIEEQLRFIANNFPCHRASELVAAIKRQDQSFFESPSVIVTIDDGYDCVYWNGAPLLEKYNIKPALFVPSAWVGYEGSDEDLRQLYSSPAHRMMLDRHGGQRSFVTADQLRELADNGWEIGGHTATHIDLGREHIDYHTELYQSRLRLGEIVGHEISLFAFPHGGRQNISPAALRAVASSGYVCCFSTCGGPNSLSTPLYFLRRDVVDFWWTPRILEGVLKGAFQRSRRYSLPEDWLSGLG